MAAVVTTAPFQQVAQEFPQRSRMQAYSDRVAAIVNEIMFIASRIPSRISDRLGRNNRYVDISKDLTWKEQSQGLYLLVHGVNGHPSIWDRHLSALNQSHPEADIVAPYVPFKGNCSLQKAAEPLLKLVQDYMQKNPEKPVCLKGVSNGSRIVAYIETRLPHDKHVKVSAIAGPFLGAKLMNLADSWKVASFLYDRDFINELKFESEAAKGLIEAMKQSPDGRYDLYVTQDDLHITPWTSGIPSLGKGEKRTIYTRVDHDSIVDRAMPEQVEACVKWMKDRQPN